MASCFYHPLGATILPNKRVRPSQTHAACAPVLKAAIFPPSRAHLDHRAEEREECAYQSGPASLVTCANARPVVAVEVFVEEQMVSPVWVLLKLFGAAVHGPPPVAVSEEDPRQAGL